MGSNTKKMIPIKCPQGILPKAIGSVTKIRLGPSPGFKLLAKTIGKIANPSNDLMNSTQFKSPVEFGIHYQHRIYSFKDISISLGIQDLIFNSISGFDASSASIFTVFSSERKFEQYTLGSYIGAGTGKIAANNFFYEDTKIVDRHPSAGQLDSLGNLIDPLNGEHDINKKKLSFIGDPIKRIEEDYLRIMRFCRFSGNFHNKISENLKKAYYK